MQKPTTTTRSGVATIGAKNKVLRAGQQPTKTKRQRIPAKENMMMVLYGHFCNLSAAHVQRRTEKSARASCQIAQLPAVLTRGTM